MYTRLSSPTNKKYVQSKTLDKWTPPHMLVGAACAAVGMNEYQAAAIAIGWEMLENWVFIPTNSWHYESFNNSFGDVIANMMGFAVAKAMGIGD